MAGGRPTLKDVAHRSGVTVATVSLVLRDMDKGDPGAGKTIMAGLLLKELIARGTAPE